MKFAIVSTHGVHKAQIRLNCQEGDCTSFLSWVDVLNGFHFNYDKLREEDPSYLKDFDLVMMSGHLNYITDIIKIADMLKDSGAVSMFYPEGSAQLYDNSIRGFHKEYYHAWNACDILSIVEEDKVEYYKRFVTPETLVKFIHVPMTEAMSSGRLFVPRLRKKMGAVVYGDNNPNHPLIAAAAANAVGLQVFAVEFGGDDASRDALNAAGVEHGRWHGKLSQAAFMRLLGESIVHFYPTEWIGTSRQVISCAAVGTPCIGSEHSHTQMRLFPELATWIYDVERMEELARKLIQNEKFYERIAAQALAASEFYNVENTTRRLVTAYERAKSVKAARRVNVA